MAGRRRGINLEAGQVWTIGRKTHDLFEKSLNKSYQRLNMPMLDMGYECTITKIDGTSVSLKDNKSGLSFTVTTERLGKLIKR